MLEVTVYQGCVCIHTAQTQVIPPMWDYFGGFSHRIFGIRSIGGSIWYWGVGINDRHVFGSVKMIICIFGCVVDGVTWHVLVGQQKAISILITNC